jgi:hypothetical protein
LGEVSFPLGYFPGGRSLRAELRNKVADGSTVYTDEAIAYYDLKDEFDHQIINHLEKYVDGRVSTNGIENFWSCLKRGLNGTYIAANSRTRRVDRSCLLGGSLAYARLSGVTTSRRWKDGNVQKSDELTSEGFNRISRETKQILERWDNRLVIPPTKLAERYIGGHLNLHLHLSVRADCPNIPRFNFPRHLLSNRRELSGSQNVKPHDVNGQDELPMLVNSVHIVNEPEWIASRISSIVRLQGLDSCQGRGIRDALYFSAVTAKFVFLNTAATSGTSLRPCVENGEFDLMRGICLEYGRGQLPSQVIERRSHMMDDLASEDTESSGDSLTYNELSQFIESFPIFIGDDWLFCDNVNVQSSGRNWSQKLGDFPSERLDILFGPF